MDLRFHESVNAAICSDATLHRSREGPRNGTAGESTYRFIEQEQLRTCRQKRWRRCHPISRRRVFRSLRCASCEARPSLLKGLMVDEYRWLEVDLQGKLAEAPLVIRAAEESDAALGPRDRHWYASANVGNIIQRFLNEEIVMVQQIKSLCAKLHVQLFMNGKDLADRRIEGPRPWSAEAVTSNHGRREGAPVGYSIWKIRSWKSRICEAHRCRKVADVIAVQTTSIYPARNLRKVVPRDGSASRRIPRNLIAAGIVRAVEVGERRTGTNRIDARPLPAALPLFH